MLVGIIPPAAGTPACIPRLTSAAFPYIRLLMKSSVANSRVQVLIVLALLTAAVTILNAGQRGAPQAAALQDGQVLPLWSGPAPGALGTAEPDVPTMTAYLPRTMTQN